MTPADSVVELHHRKRERGIQERYSGSFVSCILKERTAREVDEHGWPPGECRGRRCGLLDAYLPQYLTCYDPGTRCLLEGDVAVALAWDGDCLAR